MYNGHTGGEGRSLVHSIEVVPLSEVKQMF